MPLSYTEVVLPGVYVENVTIGGTPLLASKPFAVMLVGVSSGKLNSISDNPESLTKGSVDGKDLLEKENISSILWVSDSPSGPNGIYRLNTDYSLYQDGTTGYVDWGKATTIDPPTISSASAVEVTSTGLSAGSYYYKIEALRRKENASSYVSTKASDPSEVVVIPSEGTWGVFLEWNSVIGAEKYTIFRSQSLSDWSSSLLTTIDSGATESFLDDGSLSTSIGSPSTTNQTRRAPYVGQTYYCAYEYKTYDFLNAKEYTTLSELQSDHGKTSELGMMGQLVMGSNGTGQEAPLVIAIGLETNTDANHQLAMTEAEKVEDYPLLIVPRTTALETQRKWKAHCISMNDVRQGKDRFLITGPGFNVGYGNTSTPGTIIYNARALSDPLVVYCAPGFIYGDMWQDDGSTEEVALDGSYLAAAVAGRLSALGDPAEPGTYKPIYGISRFATKAEAPNSFNMADKTIKKLLLASGVTVVEQYMGNFRIMQAVTTSLASEEKYHLNIQLADKWLRRKIQQSLQESGIIGKKNISTVRKAIKDNVEAVLDGLIAATQIISYSDVEVKQSPYRRDWAIVLFSYKPIYPVSVIYCSYVFDLSL